MLTDPQPCPGGCNSGWRRAEAPHRQAVADLDAALTREDPADPAELRDLEARVTAARHTLRATPGQPVWCDRCGRGIAQRLLELDDLVPMLEAELGGRRTGIDETGIRTTGPAPSPSPAVDDLDEVLRTLHLWEDAYRELRGFPFRPARPADLRFTLSIRWLHGRILGILGAPFAEELGRDVLRLHSLVRRRTSTDPAKRRMPEPCPRCDLKAVTHHAGDAHVACEKCGRAMLLRDWDAYCLDLAKTGRDTGRASTCSTPTATGSPSTGPSSSPVAAGKRSSGGSATGASQPSASPASTSSSSTSSSSPKAGPAVLPGPGDPAPQHTVRTGT